jgi:hypothetical protein
MSNKDRAELIPEGKWKEIGRVGVDAGQVMIADPCHVLDENSSAWKQIELGADKLVNEHGFTYLHTVDSGYGDGSYPIEVRERDGRVAELRVRFMNSPPNHTKFPVLPLQEDWPAEGDPVGDCWHAAEALAGWADKLRANEHTGDTYALLRDVYDVAQKLEELGFDLFTVLKAHKVLDEFGVPDFEAAEDEMVKVRDAREAELRAEAEKAGAVVDVGQAGIDPGVDKVRAKLGAKDDDILYTSWSYFGNPIRPRNCARELDQHGFLSRVLDVKEDLGNDDVEADQKFLLLSVRVVPNGDTEANHDFVKEIVERHGGKYDFGEFGLSSVKNFGTNWV